jgi:uncharacterized protein
MLLELPMRTLKMLLPTCCLLLAACAGQVRNDAVPRVIGADLWSSENFRNSHPDLLHRLAGQVAYEDGDFATARTEFTKAAFYADKLSQGMLAEMDAQGDGASPDPVRAYIWMDLAAERGFVGFVAKRERLWTALSETERGLVALLGAPIYEQYGDAAALPRLGIKFRRGTSGSVLARNGSTGRARVVLPNGGRLAFRASGAPIAVGGIQMELADYFDRDLWRLDRYVAWNDRQLDLARRAMVEVGSLQSAPADRPAAH